MAKFKAYMAYQVEIQTTDSSSEANVIGAKLQADIEQKFGSSGRAPLTVILKSDSGQMQAGLRGISHWGWLWITHVWVEPAFRKQGLGKALLAEALSWAKARDLNGAYIDTFEQETAEYYIRLGFQEMGRIPDFPWSKGAAPATSRHFLYKAF